MTRPDPALRAPGLGRRRFLAQSLTGSLAMSLSAAMITAGSSLALGCARVGSGAPGTSSTAPGPPDPDPFAALAGFCDGIEPPAAAEYEAWREHESPYALAAQALAAAAALVRPGMRESELAALVRRAQEAAGLTDVWVLALSGPNAAYPHGTDAERPLAEGDLVLVDTGGSLHGYRSDITRTWVLGRPIPAQRRAWDTVHAAQSAALDAIRPGITCGAVDAVARAVMERAGHGGDYGRFTHRLGHGIGLDVHEPPYLVRGSDRVLVPGMTMSSEPGLYVPGSFGIRIEDILVVTEQGNEVFGPRARSLDAPFGPFG